MVEWSSLGVRRPALHAGAPREAWPVGLWGLSLLCGGNLAFSHGGAVVGEVQLLPLPGQEETRLRSILAHDTAGPWLLCH